MQGNAKDQLTEFAVLKSRNRDAATTLSNAVTVCTAVCTMLLAASARAQESEGPYSCTDLTADYLKHRFQAGTAQIQWITALNADLREFDRAMADGAKP